MNTNNNSRTNTANTLEAEYLKLLGKNRALKDQSYWVARTRIFARVFSWIVALMFVSVCWLFGWVSDGFMLFTGALSLSMVMFSLGIIYEKTNARRRDLR